MEMWEQLLADEKGCADVELEVRCVAFILLSSPDIVAK